MSLEMAFDTLSNAVKNILTTLALLGETYAMRMNKRQIGFFPIPALAGIAVLNFVVKRYVIYFQEEQQ